MSPASASSGTKSPGATSATPRNPMPPIVPRAGATVSNECCQASRSAVAAKMRSEIAPPATRIDLRRELNEVGIEDMLTSSTAS